MKEYEYEINGTSYRVVIKEISSDHAEVEVNGVPYEVKIKTGSFASTPVPESRPGPAPAAPPTRQTAASSRDGVINAPMPGVIVKILLAAGDKVNAGDPVMIVEAMKMENEIKSADSGTIEEIFVSKGDSVNTGDRLLRVSKG